MYELIVAKAAVLRKHLLLFSILSFMVCLLCLYFVGTYQEIIRFSHAWKGIGKDIGNIAVLTGFFCFSYYILREFYVRAKKKGWVFSGNVAKQIQKTLRLLRVCHQIVGIVMVYFIFLHAFIMILNESSYTNSVFVFGVISAMMSVVLMLVGIYIDQYVSCRQYHKIVSFIFIFAYVGHVFLRV